MDIDEAKIGVWPNVAIPAGTEPGEAMAAHGVTRTFPAMTLDEAIVHAREKAEGHGRCAADHAQLACWLEDYKRLQGVVRAQADSFASLERELAEIRRGEPGA